MITKYAQWLRDHNYSESTIRHTIPYVNRVISKYPDLKLPASIDEATAKITNGKSITTAYRNTLNGHVRRFGEFIKHQFD